MQKGLTTLNKICSYTYNFLISLPGCDKRSSPILCAGRPGCHRRHVPVLPALVPDALWQMHRGFVQGEHGQLWQPEAWVWVHRQAPQWTAPPRERKEQSGSQQAVCQHQGLSIAVEGEFEDAAWEGLGETPPVHGARFDGKHLQVRLRCL